MAPGRGISSWASWRRRGTISPCFSWSQSFHRQGIGRKLFQAYLSADGWDRVTVHSSPYAVEVYRHLGFSPTAEEQLSPDGIRYTPMIWEQ